MTACKHQITHIIILTILISSAAIYSSQELQPQREAIYGQVLALMQNMHAEAKLEQMVVAMDNGKENEHLHFVFLNAIDHGDLQTVKTILDTEPSIINRIDRSILTDATIAGHRDIAHLLIKRNADPERPNEYGFTPLMAAAFKQDALMIRTLLSEEAKDWRTDNPVVTVKDTTFRRILKALDYALEVCIKPLAPFARL